MQFSLAVSSREWSKALITAEQIIREFPNSRMAEEIREKIDALRKMPSSILRRLTTFFSKELSFQDYQWKSNRDWVFTESYLLG